MTVVSPPPRDGLSGDEWHIFNDFLVQPLPKEEALHFDPTWKLPSVIAYQLKSVGQHIDESWKQNLDTSLLYTRFLHRYHCSRLSCGRTMLISL